MNKIVLHLRGPLELENALQRDDFFDLGLAADLAMWSRTPLARRRILRMGAVGIGLLLAGCATPSASQPSPSGSAPSGGPGRPPPGGGPGGPGGPPPPVSVPTRVSANGACVEIPEQTNGPFPADGSQSESLNVLKRSGIVRSDIRTSLATKDIAAGVPTTVELTLINVNNNCAPLSGYAVYVWHCDRDGQYSLYSPSVTSEDYLRGVQATDASGKVTFQTIFPACYSGRWPHIHIEVYPSIEKATGPASLLHTAQLAVPEDVCKTVYGSAPGYTQSVTNLSQVTLKTDNVFGNTAGAAQLATVTGSVAAGYTFQLTMGVVV